MIAHTAENCRTHSLDPDRCKAFINALGRCDEATKKEMVVKLRSLAAFQVQTGDVSGGIEAAERGVIKAVEGAATSELTKRANAILVPWVDRELDAALVCAAETCADDILGYCAGPEMVVIAGPYIHKGAEFLGSEFGRVASDAVMPVVYFVMNSIKNIVLAATAEGEPSSVGSTTVGPTEITLDTPVPVATRDLIDSPFLWASEVGVAQTTGDKSDVTSPAKGREEAEVGADDFE